MIRLIIAALLLTTVAAQAEIDNPSKEWCHGWIRMHLVPDKDGFIVDGTMTWRGVTYRHMKQNSCKWGITGKDEYGVTGTYCVATHGYRSMTIAEDTNNEVDTVCHRQLRPEELIPEGEAPADETAPQ